VRRARRIGRAQARYIQRARARQIHVDRPVPGMTAELDNDPSRQPMTAQEPARRGGSIVLVLLVAARSSQLRSRSRPSAVRRPSRIF